MSNPATNQASIENFIEAMGLSSQADGLPRIAGRMMAFFVIHGGPFSFAELAEKLQISRGSVSTNARILRSLGTIERIAKPGDRQDYYQLAADPYGDLLAGYANRMNKIVDQICVAQTALANTNPAATQRLEEMQAFYNTTVESTQNLVERWRKSRQKPPQT